ncbi:acyl-CoA thioesterase [Gottfriedia luciferensis]|uniref:acyl-CoA thioesterase n=1 Tax=Gottfriedia luciferensis TaxID=178774 RepID=UPI000B4356F7|nr:thioesterase family protein [Gottfriedia luciferensis]
MGKMSYISNLQEWQSDFLFNITVKVRFSETDLFGHMNNTVPFVYFEEARIEYLHHLGLMQEWTTSGSELIPVVADLQCDYLKQVYFDEKINVFVKIANVGNSSIDLHYMGVNDKKEICFTGRNSLVNINRNTGRSEKWKNEWKEKFQNEVMKKILV